MKSNRRDFLKRAGAGTAGMALVSPIALSSCANPGSKEDDGQVLFIGDNIAVASTNNGKVRGYILRDIYTFLGIPYGADTSGENRFMPPKKPEPWTDIYPAIWYGNSAPQVRGSMSSNKNGTFRNHSNYDDFSENCLCLDVYTPGINDNKKRPVIVWLHGGGFHAGNCHEMDAFCGENFSRLGDAVFCGINHRLGAFGFTDLSAAGEKYAASGNVGMLDIVASLEWVRDNIENFGGDPGNVTIIGQSGGGGKVAVLTAMPSAKGLFHKAIALSGVNSMIKMSDRELCQKRTDYILKEAGLTLSQADQLQKLSWQDYLSISAKAYQKVNTETGATGEYSRVTPVVDGKILLQDPFLNGASPLAENVPMIFCHTVNEEPPSFNDPSVENITIEGVISWVKEKSGNNVSYWPKGYGDKAPEIVKAYSDAFPDKKPVEILSMILSARETQVMAANAKSIQPAPVYVVWFGWDPPLFDGRMRAFHCLDICFWFYNTDFMLSHTGGGARPRALSEKMARSLLQFMKTGDPNGGGLPEWPGYTEENGMTMIVNDVSEVKFDPDREARKTLPPFV